MTIGSSDNSGLEQLRQTLLENISMSDFGTKRYEMFYSYKILVDCNSYDWTQCDIDLLLDMKVITASSFLDFLYELISFLNHTNLIIKLLNSFLIRECRLR